MWQATFALLLSVCCTGTTPESRAASENPVLPTPTQPATPPVRVLMLTATAGRHDSIPVARQTIVDLASRTRAFTVTATESTADINPSTLGNTDVLMFALTTGELPFSAPQKDAIVAFVNNGGGFIGFHSATSSTPSGRTHGRRSTCCCRSTPRRSARKATTRSPGRSRSAAAAATTTRSDTSIRRGGMRRFRR